MKDIVYLFLLEGSDDGMRGFTSAEPTEVLFGRVKNEVYFFCEEDLHHEVGLFLDECPHAGHFLGPNLSKPVGE